MENETLTNKAKLVSESLGKMLIEVARAYGVKQVTFTCGPDNIKEDCRAQAILEVVFYGSHDHAHEQSMKKEWGVAVAASIDKEQRCHDSN